jgi:hypothetical protein
VQPFLDQDAPPGSGVMNFLASVLIALLAWALLSWVSGIALGYMIDLMEGEDEFDDSLVAAAGLRPGAVEEVTGVRAGGRVSDHTQRSMIMRMRRAARCRRPR